MAQVAAAAAPETDLAVSARSTVVDVLGRLDTTPSGLSDAEVTRRRARDGPNAVRTHQVRAWDVLLGQLRSPLLILLVVTAAISFGLGQRTDASVIGVILAVSIGLGFRNEYRAERAAQALHSQIVQRVAVVRGGHAATVNATDLVIGDIVRIELGSIVPADLRLVETTGLRCDESILTGESTAVAKTAEPVDDMTSCAYMGTVVHAGSALGVVVSTGGRTVFGRIALSLGDRLPETEFQIGLRRFSAMLVKIAAVLTAVVFATNLLLHRPLLDALLFSLAIAVGITPQLLPAVVSTSLASGSRRLIALKVLVKRLVCIEDLGDIDVLFTDKTGTLTDGRIRFSAALDADGRDDEHVFVRGLLCTDNYADGEAPVGGNAMDAALWQAAGEHRPTGWRQVAALPFDHERLMSSVLTGTTDGARLLIVKGAPETVLARCVGVTDRAQQVLAEQFAAGSRVVAVASRPAPGLREITADDESRLTLDGFLVFLDTPKPSAAAALTRLGALGIQVKVVTGDNAVVARRVCEEVGLAVTGVLTGADLAGLDDKQLAAAIPGTTVFARVDPEQKSRIITVQRKAGLDVAFLGDGVNDAVALHHADVGISVESGTDVAKDAADVILLEKDLGVLADGVVQGRRVFTNTIKYVLMGTSSNFGNMFSAAAASAFLSFLPMLPSQILLNNLLYDSSQLAIPGDRVDEESLRRPARWDLGLIRRFMMIFGPASSLFDFLTFAALLGVLHAGPAQFQTGWFVESLATQTLVIFVIRTRRVPFWRSRPSLGLIAAATGCVAIGVLLPVTPLAGLLGFTPLPSLFFLALAIMVVLYLGLVEAGKLWFFAAAAQRPGAGRSRRRSHRIHRRAARFSHPGPLPR